MQGGGVEGKTSRKVEKCTTTRNLKPVEGDIGEPDMGPITKPALQSERSDSTLFPGHWSRQQLELEGGLSLSEGQGYVVDRLAQ
jgi:hypothetical protein